jgi:hypothetical protein
LGITPKLGANPAGGADASATVDGPDELSLGVALARRLNTEPVPVGPTPYLLGGTPVEERLLSTSHEKDQVLSTILALGQRYSLSDEKLRRIETSADELMLNALYDAPRDESGKALYANLDRRKSVSLGAQAQVRVRWGADPRTFAVSVTDRFGALERSAVVTHIQRVLEGRTLRRGGVQEGGGAGLGLVLAFTAANQLIVQVVPGKFTEVTAVIHIAGANRLVSQLGSSLHLYL